MKQSLKMAGVATLSAGVGLVVGYKIAERQLGARFEERLEAETADMKEFYTNVKQRYNTPEEAAAALIPQTEEVAEDPRVKTQRIQYNKIVKQEKYDGLNEFSEAGESCEIEETVVTQNVFEQARDLNQPYIISQEEFIENERGFEQATLTWYSRGGVLADVRDEPIGNVGEVIGNDFSTRFGDGSSDEHTVHVRNEKLRMEFEVVKSDRSYEEDVLGQDPT